MVGFVGIVIRVVLFLIVFLLILVFINGCIEFEGDLIERVVLPHVFEHFVEHGDQVDCVCCHDIIDLE